MSDNLGITIIVVVFFLCITFLASSCNQEFEETRRLRLTIEASREQH